jgi:hypothetical protein
MTQNRRHVHRHQFFGLAQVGADEDLKMPILTALIVPALAYVPAAPAAGRKANRNRNCAGNGAPNRSNIGAMRWAT